MSPHQGNTVVRHVAQTDAQETLDVAHHHLPDGAHRPLGTEAAVPPTMRMARHRVAITHRRPVVGIRMTVRLAGTTVLPAADTIGLPEMIVLLVEDPTQTKTGEDASAPSVRRDAAVIALTVEARHRGARETTIVTTTVPPLVAAVTIKMFGGQLPIDPSLDRRQFLRDKHLSPSFHTNVKNNCRSPSER